MCVQLCVSVFSCDIASLCAPPQTPPDVMESASSSRMILCRPGGSVTFFCANILILLRTTSMPRSSDAFSSNTASLYDGPKRVCAKARMEVVFPMPGGPVKMRFGMLPVCAMALSRSTASLFPTISSIFDGRYFSTQGNIAFPLLEAAILIQNNQKKKMQLRRWCPPLHSLFFFQKFESKKERRSFSSGRSAMRELKTLCVRRKARR